MGNSRYGQGTGDGMESTMKTIIFFYVYIVIVTISSIIFETYYEAIIFILIGAFLLSLQGCYIIYNNYRSPDLNFRV